MKKRISLLLIVLLLLPSTAGAWGEKGHLLVNRLALEKSQSKLPTFMGAAAAQIIYNGYEPDRWRAEGDTPLNAAQAPDHFFDSELWGSIATIEKDRYSFMASLETKKVDLAKVGYLPYSILENFGRLRNAFRNWRNAGRAEDREAARANAVFYAGLLGHYVADSTMPMHLSIHYNGWAEGSPNPRNFTRDRSFHSRYEVGYVATAITDALVRPGIRPPERLTDVLSAVKKHLTQTFGELEPMYVLEQAGQFKPDSPRPEGTTLIASQLARAATMLGSLWYTAWVESAEPVPPR